jgi:hypothetical protein
VVVVPVVVMVVVVTAAASRSRLAWATERMAAAIRDGMAQV